MFNDVTLAYDELEQIRAHRVILTTVEVLQDSKDFPNIPLVTEDRQQLEAHGLILAADSEVTVSEV